MISCSRATLACALLAVLLTSRAYAALPDEIQVYTGDLTPPRQFGLEVHLNTTPSGSERATEPGVVPTAHAWRTTADSRPPSIGASTSRPC
jgi:hypothetical protein